VLPPGTLHSFSRVTSKNTVKQVWSGECEEQSREELRYLQATWGEQDLLSCVPNQAWSTSDGYRVIQGYHVRCHSDMVNSLSLQLLKNK